MNPLRFDDQKQPMPKAYSYRADVLIRPQVLTAIKQPATPLHLPNGTDVQ